MNSRWLLHWTCLLACSMATPGWAQSVCLPAPRLLTTFPMGGKAGSEVEITITGEHLDNARELVFSDARLSAQPVLDAAGQPIPNKYRVAITSECPDGVYEARVMTRLGLSAARVFSVGHLDEVLQAPPNTTLDKAQPLPLNSVCNARMSVKSMDHYRFSAKQGQRIVVECATRGIDSKLDAVVIVADAAGRDLLVERRGGVLDFSVPKDGDYVVKVHELTFKGGADYFYRLGIWEQALDTPIVRMPGTRTVNSFSWPPTDLPATPSLAEVEPNNAGPQVQKITLPCDIAGSFFPAADIDLFEFEAKQGEEWWIEVGSERLGRPTDPAVLVQLVTRNGEAETLTDVAEFGDIPSPVKVSSNGYAYDGPPYDAGTADSHGKLVIKQDGTYRLQILDLFGGTRNDARNVYRLVVRKAAPDFALVSWALHMELRNGDRNALSKPISLRGGSTMALEVVAIRRDGFDGDIDLVLEGLPEGVTASGLKIPAGQSRGMVLVTAHQEAPRAFTNASFAGRSTINGATVMRPCRFASMAWPIPDAWGEIPSPRLVADVPVSVSGVDFAPLSISPASRDVVEVTAGQTLTIPLVHARRSEFSGDKMQLKAIGAGFERVPAFDISLTSDASEAKLDLAALKTPPGDYVIAFLGSAVAKYRHHPEAVAAAELEQKAADDAVTALQAEVQTQTAATQSAPADQQPAAKAALDAVTAKHQSAVAAAKAAAEKVKQVTAVAAPKDIVDIVTSEPIAIRVKPAESK